MNTTPTSQASYDHHIYYYSFPLEDWEVKPPRGETTHAEMEYMPHSNRLYFYWSKEFSNPIRPLDPNQPHGLTHWGTIMAHYTTTFYLREDAVPKHRLPEPYKRVSVTLKYGKAGGPQSDDPLGSYPVYEVINVERHAYDRCSRNDPQ